MGPIIEFFLQLVAMERFLVEFITIHRKSIMRMHAKQHDTTEKTVVFGLWIKPQTNGFHEFVLPLSILLQLDRSQLTAVNCNRGRGVKTTPRKTRFCSVNSTRNSRTGQNWVNGYSDKNSIDDTKHKSKPNSVWNDCKHWENTCECERWRSWCQCMSHHAL